MICLKSKMTKKKEEGHKGCVGPLRGGTLKGAARSYNFWIHSQPFSQQATVKVSVCFHRKDRWVVAQHPTISVTVQNHQFYNHAKFTQWLARSAGVRQEAGFKVLRVKNCHFLSLWSSEILWMSLRKDWKCVWLWSHLNNYHITLLSMMASFSFVTARNTVPFRRDSLIWSSLFQAFWHLHSVGIVQQ